MHSATVNPEALMAGRFEPHSHTGPGYPAVGGTGIRQRRPAAKGLRLAQAACGVGLAYAAISVYWALGGTWLLDTVGGTLDQQGHTANPGLILAVCAAAALKVIGAIVPLAAMGVTPGRATSAGRRKVRVLAWLEAAILTIYGLVLTAAGLLVQSGAIAPAAGADHRALAWHAYLWDPWFLLWGTLVAAALLRSRQPGRRGRTGLAREPIALVYQRHAEHEDQEQPSRRGEPEQDRREYGLAIRGEVDGDDT